VIFAEKPVAALPDAVGGLCVMKNSAENLR